MGLKSNLRDLVTNIGESMFVDLLTKYGGPSKCGHY
jgi:hypothetical protein